jgi:CheY-like chemotaxis protein
MCSEISLAGLRVLVLEDDLLSVMLVEATLEDEGCVIVGPVDNLAEGLRLAGSEKLDAAVMDVNIGGEKAYPIAKLLEQRGVPFLLISGYGQSAIPEAHPGWVVCSKPFRGEEMLNMLVPLIAKSRQ